MTASAKLRKFLSLNFMTRILGERRMSANQSFRQIRPINPCCFIHQTAMSIRSWPKNGSPLKT